MWNNLMTELIYKCDRNCGINKKMTFITDFASEWEILEVFAGMKVESFLGMENLGTFPTFVRRP